MGQRVLPLGAVVLMLTVVGGALGSSPAEAQQPKRGGVLHIAERELPASVSFLTQSWASLSYSQLVRFPYRPEQKHAADFSIVPDLAERWESRMLDGRRAWRN